MSSQYLDYKKDGLTKLIQLAKTLCKLILTFEVIIRAKYGDNIAIIALVDAVKNLCALLPAADEAFSEFADDTPPPSEDPAEIPGIDPTAPPAADPDIV